MMQYWSEFAKNGNPDRSSNKNLARWEKWKTFEGDSKIMILDTISSGGSRIINSHVPIDALVETFNNDPRSKKSRINVPS